VFRRLLNPTLAHLESLSAMLFRSFIFSLVAIAFLTLEASGQSLSREARLQLGKHALADQNWELAEEQAAEILARWPKDQDGLILRLETALFRPEPDVDLARSSLKSLPRATRNSDYIKGLDLWMDYQYGRSFMPSIKIALQLRRAKNIIEKDPQNSFGNLVAGSIKLEDYRDQNNSVRLASVSDLDQIIALAGKALGTGGRYIATEGGSNVEVPIIRDESVEKNTNDEAIQYLVEALKSGPLRPAVLRMLGEAAIRGKKYDIIRAAAETFITDFPDNSSGYLYLGLTLFLQGHLAEASIRFERGIERLSDDDRWAFEDPTNIVSTKRRGQFSADSDSATTDFWARQDHLWSSPTNERLVEHRARVVYADLVWGRPHYGFRGWETEPGQVVIRYGWPLMEMQFQNDYDQFYYLDYGYRYWVFMDLAKADRYTLWSPPGGTLSATRLCDRGRGGLDVEKCAKEWFRDDPQRSQRTETTRVKMTTLSSVFEDGNQRIAVLPFCFPETDQLPGNQLALFDREAGQSVPLYGRALKFVDREKHWSEMPCDIAQVAVQQVDTGGHQLSLEVEGLRGYATSRIDIAPSSSEGLRLSDLLLARLVEELDAPVESGSTPTSTVATQSWTRYGKTIYPVASPEFKSGTPIYLYLETYGLPEDTGSDLSFQAALVEGTLKEDLSPKLGRIFGKSEKAIVSVEFDQHIQGSTDSRYFILETLDVAPGTYVLAVRVLEQRTGRQSVISRDIVIE
jgi:GWxTD domain-containing protein